MEQSEELKNADNEKRAAALSTVSTAIFITTMKLVVGVATGSLGILAEAADSGLDVVAAVLTLAAVRVSGRPPDETHTYGHGKVENLAALVETLLLLLTCGWIVYEGVNRLFFKTVEVDANIWAFAVVAISMALDINRMRALQRAAEKHKSQALEASALRFRTDIWTSSVVLAGLVLIRVQEWTGGPLFLLKADAVAGLGVALVVLIMGIQLGKRAVDVLLDTAPRGLADEIKTQVEKIEGVTACHQVRVRPAGAETFVDIVLEMVGEASFERAHETTHKVEAVVRQLAPGADVLVHYEPGDLDHALVPRIRAIAQGMGADTHSVWARQEDGHLHVELHLEVDREASLEQAHDVASHLEAAVKEAIPEVAELVAHLEPSGDITNSSERLNHVDHVSMEEVITDLVNALSGPGACHDVAIWEERGRLSASLHCSFSPDVSVDEAHQLSERLEERVRDRFPKLQRVVIHVEPATE